MLNAVQRRWLLATLVLFLAAGLFPPYALYDDSSGGYPVRVGSGTGFLLAPDLLPRAYGATSAVIDVRALVVEWFIILAATGGAIVLTAGAAKPVVTPPTNAASKAAPLGRSLPIACVAVALTLALIAQSLETEQLRLRLDEQANRIDLLTARARSIQALAQRGAACADYITPYIESDDTTAGWRTKLRNQAIRGD